MPALSIRPFALAALTLVAGCAGGDTPEEAADAVSDSTAITVRGVVVETLYDGEALRVDHEAVPSLGMQAMQMAFPLDRAALADGLAPGDKVALTISAAPRLRITEVRPLPASTPLTLASRPAADSTAADTAAVR